MLWSGALREPGGDRLAVRRQVLRPGQAHDVAADLCQGGARVVDHLDGTQERGHVQPEENAAVPLVGSTWLEPAQ